MPHTPSPRVGLATLLAMFVLPLLPGCSRGYEPSGTDRTGTSAAPAVSGHEKLPVGGHEGPAGGHRNPGRWPADLPATNSSVQAHTGLRSA
jgi:hypothetical protein